MKRVIVIFLAVILLVMATPVSAAKGPVGERFHVWFGTPTTFPAGAPFYIEHGWVDDVGIPQKGNFGFTVTVDGVLYDKADYKVRINNGGIITYEWGYNFPAGLPAGTHVFVGHWWVPCKYYVSVGDIPGPCTSPSYERFTQTLIVDFLPVP